MELYIVGDWNKKNIAFRLNDVKKVIAGKCNDKAIHHFYNNSAARNSAFKILTKEDFLIPSKNKPIKVQGMPLKLDSSSSNALGNRYSFVSYNNGLIAISIK